MNHQGDTCPLCTGSKNIWGSCCSGYECGCYGLPVTIDCTLCKQTGILTKDIIDPEEIENLLADIKEQEETQQWMEETYPDYFKRPNIE